MTSICNHECIWAYTVTARTEKTITLTDGKETLKRRINQKISEYSNTETVPPHPGTVINGLQSDSIMQLWGGSCCSR